MFSIRKAVLVTACLAALGNPALAESGGTASTDIGSAHRTGTAETALDEFQNRLAKLGDQAKQLGDDAVAAGRAAIDAARAKLREREEARRALPSRSGNPPLGVEVSNI